MKKILKYSVMAFITALLFVFAAACQNNNSTSASAQAPASSADNAVVKAGYDRGVYKHGHGPSSWIPLLTRKLFTMEGLQRSIRKLLNKYDYDQSSLTADYTDGLRGVMRKEVNGVYSPYEFEGETVMGIQRYDDYLTQIYGDYMQIPQGDHQRQHNFHYLDLNKPYREYKDAESPASEPGQMEEDGRNQQQEPQKDKEQ